MSDAKRENAVHPEWCCFAVTRDDLETIYEQLSAAQYLYDRKNKRWCCVGCDEPPSKTCPPSCRSRDMLDKLKELLSRGV